MASLASWLGTPAIREYNYNLHINFLPSNHAYVVLNSTFKYFVVYSVKEDCYKCPWKRQAIKYNAYSQENMGVFEVYTGEHKRWIVTHREFGEYLHRDYTEGQLCEMRGDFEEYGVYRIDTSRCEMVVEVPPVNFYLPLLLYSLIMLSVIAAFGLIKLFLRRRNNQERHNNGLNLTAKRDNSDIMPSLHFLRGILLILLIFVTTGGGGYAIFSNNYGGLTVANCLLFIFMLSLGLKIPVMFDEDSRKAVSKASILGTIFLRSLVLFIVGITIRETAPRSRFVAAPLWAPLHCIAISYFTVAVSYMISTRQRGIKPKNPNMTAGNLLWSWVFAAVFVVIILISTVIFYYTECEEPPYINSEANMWLSFENICKKSSVFSEVFNKNMLRLNWDEAFYVDTYYTYTEGLLGMISYILVALVGLKVGAVYVEHEDHSTRIKQWGWLAAILAAAGIILSLLYIPLNFNLWPVSTLFFISSGGIIFYISVYYLTEVRQVSSNIIITCGAASIATFSGHLLFSQSFPFYWGVMETHFFYLWESTWIVCLWVFITVKCSTRLISSVVSDEGTRRVILAW